MKTLNPMGSGGPQVTQLRKQLPGSNFLAPTQRMIGPQITRMDAGTFGSKRADMPLPRDRNGPVRSAPLSFFTPLGESYVLAQADENRVGMILVNLDPANALFYNFGGAASISTGRLNATQTLLLDFICPTDQFSVFAAAQQFGYFVSFSKMV